MSTNRSIRAPLLVTAAFVTACTPVQATEAASVVLPWGDGLVAAIQALASLLFPVLVAAVAGFAAQVAGPLRFLVTSTLVERLVRNATDYALNAVAGAVRGRTLTVPVGSAVVAQAVERALQQGPDWLVRRAGGRVGIAEKVFRVLDLEDGATRANTLQPALRASGDAARR